MPVGFSVALPFWWGMRKDILSFTYLLVQLLTHTLFGTLFFYFLSLCYFRYTTVMLSLQLCCKIYLHTYKQILKIWWAFNPSITCVRSQSSNQFIRFIIQNIRSIQLPVFFFSSTKPGGSYLLRKSMNTLCLLKFTAFCVLPLLGLPLSLLLVHTSQREGEETTHQHCCILQKKKERKNKRKKTADYCCLVRYKHCSC